MPGWPYVCRSAPECTFFYVQTTALSLSPRSLDSTALSSTAVSHDMYSCTHSLVRLFAIVINHSPTSGSAKKCGRTQALWSSKRINTSNVFNTCSSTLENRAVIDGRSISSYVTRAHLRVRVSREIPVLQFRHLYRRGTNTRPW